MLPNRKASGKAKRGDKGNRLLCHGHNVGLFAQHLPLGKHSLTPHNANGAVSQTLVQGLDL